MGIYSWQVLNAKILLKQQKKVSYPYLVYHEVFLNENDFILDVSASLDGIALDLRHVINADDGKEKHR